MGFSAVNPLNIIMDWQVRGLGTKSVTERSLKLQLVRVPVNQHHSANKTRQAKLLLGTAVQTHRHHHSNLRKTVEAEKH